jgi:hypothetical protein
LRLHGSACGQGNEDGDNDGHEVKDGRNRKLDWISTNDDGVVVGQVGGMGPFEDGKDNIEEEECDYRKGGEDAPFKAASLPKYRGIAEGAKPEQVDPVGEGGASAEDDCGKGAENK